MAVSASPVDHTIRGRYRYWGRLLLVIYLATVVSLGLLTAAIGKRKGSSPFIWFIVGSILPLIGLLAVVLYRYECDELRRPCNGCGKQVELYDQVCNRCGTDLYFPA